MNNNIGIPKVPKYSSEMKKVNPPERKKKTGYKIEDFEYSWQLIIYLLSRGIRTFPKIALKVLLPLAIVTVINIFLETIPTYSLYGVKRSFVLLLVTITASYNSPVPRALYWVIILTIGKSLFKRIKREGVSKVIGDFKSFPKTYKKTKNKLSIISNYLLIMGIGIGFFMANYLSRNNRFDKISVCFVVAIALINTLSKGKKGLLFTAFKLFFKDLSKINKVFKEITVDHTYLILSGIVLGLVGNTIFAIIKFGYGGYILGTLLFIAAVFLVVFNKNEVSEDGSKNS